MGPLRQPYAAMLNAASGVAERPDRYKSGLETKEVRDDGRDRPCEGGYRAVFLDGGQ
jgi:hypothetical protein